VSFKKDNNPSFLKWIFGLWNIEKIREISEHIKIPKENTGYMLDNYIEGNIQFSNEVNRYCEEFNNEVESKEQV